MEVLWLHITKLEIIDLRLENGFARHQIWFMFMSVGSLIRSVGRRPTRQVIISRVARDES